MKKTNRIVPASGALLLILGAVAAFFFRGTSLPFAMSLILALVGLVVLIAGLLPKRQRVNTRTLALAAMFAALCYIGFTFLRIDIPVGTEKTAFHLGNVFCVLGALYLGGLWGGAAGAVGMTIADLTTGYVTSAPKTFFLKLCIGLITGLIAHKCFRINKITGDKGRLTLAALLSSLAGMAFNVVADPMVGYFYKTYLLGIPQDAAVLWAKIGAVTTLVNAVIAVIASTVLYLALRPALKRTNLTDLA